MDGTPLTARRIPAVLEEIPALILVLGGRDLHPVLGPPDGIEQLGAAVEPILREVCASGRTVHVPAWEGRDRVWDLVVAPLRDAPGDAAESLVVHATDVS